MSIENSEIEKIARLARIRVDDAESGELGERLNDILSMVDRLQAVDTEGVTPMDNPLDATAVLRADEVTETDQRERYQSVAPKAEEGLYLVPKVIE